MPPEIAAAARAVVRSLDGVFIWYFVVINFFYGVLFLLATWDTVKQWTLVTRLRVDDQLDDEVYPPVSLIVPAYQEENHVVRTVRALLSLDYPEFEVVVVNDGSSDATMRRLREAFELFEVPPAVPRRLETAPVRGYFRSATTGNLQVVDKANGGKADALNAGLDAARSPYVATVDADTIVERGALRRIVRPLLVGTNVVGAGGTIRVANDSDFEESDVVAPRVPSRFFPAVQVPEYLRAFLFGRLGWNYLGGNLILSGAFAFFRRDLVQDIGGFETESITEDVDVVVGLHRRLREAGRSERILFVPDPVAWTEVPETMAGLGRQREGWHRGLTRTIFRNLRVLFNPRYGLVGTVVFPFFLFGEVLAPIVESLGYLNIVVGLSVGVLDLQYALLFLAVAGGWQMMLSVASVLVEDLTYRAYPDRSDLLRLVGAALVEPLGYRQLTVWWRMKAFWNLARGERGRWQVERTAVETAVDTAA